jgi:hypothetical protein
MSRRLLGAMAGFAVGCSLLMAVPSGPASAAPLPAKMESKVVERQPGPPAQVESIVKMAKPKSGPDLCEEARNSVSSTSTVIPAWMARGNHKPKTKATWTTKGASVKRANIPGADDRDVCMVNETRWKQLKKAKHEHPLWVRMRQYRRVCYGFCRWDGNRNAKDAKICFAAVGGCKGGPKTDKGWYNVHLDSANMKWEVPKVINLNPKQYNGGLGVYSGVWADPDGDAKKNLVAVAED